MISSRSTRWLGGPLRERSWFEFGKSASRAGLPTMRSAE
jgi:hypothetical protein